jgi:hypothetical protein
VLSVGAAGIPPPVEDGAVLSVGAVIPPAEGGVMPPPEEGIEPDPLLSVEDGLAGLLLGSFVAQRESEGDFVHNFLRALGDSGFGAGVRPDWANT